MKTNIYINGIGSISRLNSTNEIQDNIIEPNYKELIPAMKLRRMSRVMRMNNFSAMMALKQAKVDTTEAINVGTGLGCLIDTEKFLSTLLDNNEAFSNPSAFINSTHNTLAGNLAILLGTKGQNFTFVNSENSFENALIDASIGLEEDSFNDILVGGVDEKTEILETVCSAKNIGEGASFIFVSKEKTRKSLAKISGIKVDNSNLDLDVFIDDFLNEIGVSIDSVDLVLSSNFEFDIPTIVYHEISGDYPTASAFACTLAAEIIAAQNIPKFSSIQMNEINNILIYSNYSSESKSLLLLSNIIM